MFDTDAEGVAEEGDCVFGDELFEGDEECCFQCYVAVDDCSSVCSWSGMTKLVGDGVEEILTL